MLMSLVKAKLMSWRQSTKLVSQQDPEWILIIDLVEEKTDVDLKQLMATPRRDEKLEIEETNREIVAVLNSLGADTAKYRRERSK